MSKNTTKQNYTQFMEWAKPYIKKQEKRVNKPNNGREMDKIRQIRRDMM